MTADTKPVAAPTPIPQPTQLRASDAERTETIARLHHALGEGRLDLTETDVRVAAAYAAQYRSELGPLLADLPEPHDPPGASAAPSWSAVWSTLVWRARIAVLGADVAGRERPTARQCRVAAVLLAVAACWFLISAVLGAGMLA